jgi:CysZ protein
MNQSATGIGTGLRAFAGGIGFVLTTPSLWGYALVPVVMMFLLTCGLGLLGIWGSARLSAGLFGEDLGIWQQLGSWLVTGIFALGAALVAVLLALALAQPLSGFALEAIVQAQERALTGHATVKQFFAVSTFHSAVAVLAALLVGAPTLAVLFLVGWLFPAAMVVTVPLKFLVGGWLLAWDFLDYPLGLRAVGFRGRLRWIRRHFDAFTAFGLAWAVLVVLPGVVLLLLPMGVAGATRLVVEQEVDGASK